MYLPPGSWQTVLDCLCEHFRAISREQWLDRIARGRVLDGNGQPITVGLPYKEGLRIHYFREVPDEKPIPVVESILYADEHLVVADKPHFLPVTPAGEYVEQVAIPNFYFHVMAAYAILRHNGVEVGKKDFIGSF